MKSNRLTFSFAALMVLICSSFNWIGNDDEMQPGPRFDQTKDLLLVQFDCKTDVDDLQTAAALATLLSNSEFRGINYHAVAGTYGIQEGLYVNPNALMELAFKGNWTDAHKDFGHAVRKVAKICEKTLKKGGDVWIAEAGQSDFSAALIKALAYKLPGIDLSKRLHVVQHSDWNEESTSADNLSFVKENSDYHKIPDGNAVGNGTPGFRTPGYSDWTFKVKDPGTLKIWTLAVELSNKYNGQEGRYNNEAVEKNGLDFSDLAEVCYILGLEDMEDTAAFFDRFGG
jgi:hypothetical protein